VTDPRAEYDRRLTGWRERIARHDRVNLHISNGRLFLAIAGAVLLWMAFARVSISPAWPAIAWVAFGVLAVVHARHLQVYERARSAERVYLRGLDRLGGRPAGTAGRSSMAIRTPAISICSGPRRSSSCSTQPVPRSAKRRSRTGSARPPR